MSFTSLTVSTPFLTKFTYLKASIKISNLEFANKYKEIKGKVGSSYSSFACDKAILTTLLEV
jgi:hypothetical protein